MIRGLLRLNKCNMMTILFICSQITLLTVYFSTRMFSLTMCYVLSHFSHVWLSVTLQTIVYQAPLSMGFSCISFSNPNPGIEPGSLALQADALSSEPPGKPLLSFHAKMGSIKGRNGMDLTEAEDIKKRWEEYTELYKKDLKVKITVVSNSLWPHGLYSPWNSPDQNTGVGSLSLLQGIFATQESNPGLLHCRRILYQLSQKGSPYKKRS